MRSGESGQRPAAREWAKGGEEVGREAERVGRKRRGRSRGGRSGGWGKGGEPRGGDATRRRGKTEMGVETQRTGESGQRLQSDEGPKYVESATFFMLPLGNEHPVATDYRERLEMERGKRDPYPREIPGK